MPNDLTIDVGHIMVGLMLAPQPNAVVGRALTSLVYCLLNCQSGDMCYWSRCRLHTTASRGIATSIPYIPNESTIAVGHNGWPHAGHF